MTFYSNNEIIATNNIRLSDTIEIGKGTKIAPWVEIGDNVIIGQNCYVGPFNKIADGVRIGNDTIVASHNNIERQAMIGNSVTFEMHGTVGPYSVIEDNVFIGPHFSMADVKEVPMGPHGKSPYKEATKTNPIRIGAGSILGARVTLLPGIDIGKGSVIDMHSLVTKNTLPSSHIRGPKIVVAKELTR
jgi:acetyltransferase-like isoleucine patch superfamily enzyme